MIKPKSNIFKIYVDFSRAYWYLISAATVSLFGAALNVLRIYDDSLEEDQQRLIPEELRLPFFDLFKYYIRLINKN